MIRGLMDLPTFRENGSLHRRLSSQPCMVVQYTNRRLLTQLGGFARYEHRHIRRVVGWDESRRYQARPIAISSARMREYVRGCRMPSIRSVEHLRTFR